MYAGPVQPEDRQVPLNMSLKDWKRDALQIPRAGIES